MSKRLRIFLAVAFFLLLAFVALLSQTTGGGGGTTGTNGFSLQFQNGGVTIFFGRKFAAVNCSTGLTCTYSSGVITMTAGGSVGTITGTLPGQGIVGGAVSGGANTAAYIDASVLSGLSGVNDMCDKIAKAGTLATAAGITVVDARGFSGTQVCTPITSTELFWGVGGAVIAGSTSNSWPTGGLLQLGNVTLRVGSNNSIGNVINVSCVRSTLLCTITITANAGQGHWTQGQYVTFSNIATATFLEGGPRYLNGGAAGGVCVPTGAVICQSTYRLQPGTTDTSLVVSILTTQGPLNNIDNYTSAADTGIASALGTPAVELPNKAKIIGVGAVNAAIQADGTNCSNLPTLNQNCTNFGVRLANIVNLALSGTGLQCTTNGATTTGTTCWTNLTVTGLTSNQLTGATASEAVNVVTMTTGAGNWPASYATGETITVTGCSVTGYNITALITGGNGTTTITYNDPTGALGAATGCTVNLQGGMVPAAQSGELVQVRSLTSGVVDNNWGMFVVCNRNKPQNNGNCPVASGAVNQPTGPNLMYYNRYATTNAVATGTVLAGTALVAFAEGTVMEGNNGNAVAIDAAQVQIEKISVDCNDVPGCISIQNVSSEEESYANWVSAKGSSFAGWDNHNGGASGGSNGGPWLGNQVIVGGTIHCDYDTIAFYAGNSFTRNWFGMTIVNNPTGCIYPASGSSPFSGTRAPSVNDQTVTGNGGTACTTGTVTQNTECRPQTAVLYDETNGGNDLEQFHIEGFFFGVDIGENLPSQGVLIAGYLGHSTVQTCVHVSNNFAHTAPDGGSNFTSDITITRIGTGVSGCPVATIQDDIQQVTDTDNVTGFYAWDRVSPTGVPGIGLTNLVNTDPNILNRLGGNNVQLASAQGPTSAGLTTITGLSFPVVANSKYTMTCTLYVQISATTADIIATVTGPAAPTSVDLSFSDPNSAATVKAFNATAFAGSLGFTSSTTATTNFPMTLTMSLQNGVNAGTVQVQIGRSGAGAETWTVGANSNCTINAL